MFIDAGGKQAMFRGEAGRVRGHHASQGRTEERVCRVVRSSRRHLPAHACRVEGGIYALTETGILTRLDSKTGKLSYKTRLDSTGGAGYFTTSPWAYNGKIFCLSEEGKTYVVAAGEKFELLHTNMLDEMAMATPAIVGDRLIVRTDSRLYSIRQPASNR